MGEAKGKCTQIVYGIIPVEEALRAGRRRVYRLWISRTSSNPRIRSLRGFAKGIPIEEVSGKELHQLTQGGTHQGVVAKVGPYPWLSLKEVCEGTGPLILCDRIQDPQNLGGIIRSSVALGARGIIVEKRRSAPLSAAVAKAASGALEYSRLCQVSNLSNAIIRLKDWGFWIAGTTDQGGRELWEGDFPDPIAVVLGGEGPGIRPVVRKGCDLWISIPSVGKIKTYNVSVAAALVMYELLRSSKKAIDNKKNFV